MLITMKFGLSAALEVEGANNSPRAKRQRLNRIESIIGKTAFCHTNEEKFCFLCKFPEVDLNPNSLSERIE